MRLSTINAPFQYIINAPFYYKCVFLLQMRLSGINAPFQCVLFSAFGFGLYNESLGLGFLRVSGHQRCVVVPGGRKTRRTSLLNVLLFVFLDLGFGGYMFYGFGMFQGLEGFGK